MSELAKAYDPKEIEGKLFQFWDKGGYFRADPHSKKPAYSIVIPPPNVTGVLHMGHALVNTLQDILVRWKRMSGFETLWVPGTDHAGISTQTVVERHLMKTQNKRRTDFTREEFLSHVWDWKEKSQNQILSQLKRLGCSCDWSRLCFTMDETRSRAVRVMFKKWFDSGLIYRGDYLVNWDPATQTAIADDEVEYEDRSSFLYFIRYPVEGSTQHLVIATTRPETMLGDTAVAVSPDDERYRKFQGKQVRLPLMDRLIPVVADRWVDPAFGTGAVKITPAHDPNDYEIRFRHTLPLINIMTPDGRINENGKEFAGLTMEEARKAVVKKLEQLNLVEKILPYEHRVGVSYRSKADIQPYLSKQWFVKTSAFKERLISLVKDGKVKLIPPHWESTYFHWIENLRDWCISRQLWWGHRIPIWYNKQNPEKMICFADAGIPPEVAASPEEWVQEDDVLDTWFSAGIWPISVFGWPDKTPELAKFYPTSTLVTGHDILFFWVARMIMMCDDATGLPPFPETFLHGLIYGKSYWRFNKDGSMVYITGEEKDKYDSGAPIPGEVQHKWEKMSKTKGNVIDPLEIIDTYGTDAMRIALAASATYARQIDLDRRRFEEFKHFANKIWNGARFVFMNLEGLSPESGLHMDSLTLEDKWILSLLNRTIRDVDSALSGYAFDKAATLAYEFFWKEFCAYYVELTKPTLFGKTGTPEQKQNKQNILLIVLCAAIRLMHPMAPFITEELFQELKKRFGNLTVSPQADAYTKEALTALNAPACLVAPYPQVINPQDIQPKIEEAFAFMDEVLRVIRNIRAEMQLPPSIATDLFIEAAPQDPSLKTVQENASILHSLLRLQQIHVGKVPSGSFSQAIVGGLKLMIPLPTEMNDKEKARLNKEKEKLIAQQNSLRIQLSNEDFIQKAPPPLVEKLRANLAQSEASLAEIAKKLETL